MKLSDLKSWADYWEQLWTALLKSSVDKLLLEALLHEAHTKMPVAWCKRCTVSGKAPVSKITRI